MAPRFGENDDRLAFCTSLTCLVRQNPLLPSLGTLHAKSLTSPEWSGAQCYRETIMTNFASTLVAQVSVGFMAFVVSAACILSATGPLQIVG